jgi:hypothetical protein
MREGFNPFSFLFSFVSIRFVSIRFFSSNYSIFFTLSVLGEGERALPPKYDVLYSSSE